jgi:hypothetical protein
VLNIPYYSFKYENMIINPTNKNIKFRDPKTQTIPKSHLNLPLIQLIASIAARGSTSKPAILFDHQQKVTFLEQMLVSIFEESAVPD